jgi:hypothetical protein
MCCVWKTCVEKYFFPEVLRIQQVFECVAISYNSCEFYNEIPKNYFFMIFLAKSGIFPQNPTGARLHVPHHAV